MSWRRILVVAGLAFFVGLPMLVLAGQLLRHPEAWSVWLEWRRLLVLTKSTVGLVCGVIAIDLPLGTAIALLLYRSDLAGRVFLRRMIALALFIPLPVLASAWQSALGSGGWWPLRGWQTIDPADPDLAPTGIAWKPWASGLPASIWVHACAGLPWCIWLAGLGLSNVERNLEEDAHTAGGVWRVLRHATLPRAWPALTAAAIWVGLLAYIEVTVTDMMQVSTLAEEVYVQFARPDPPRTDESRDVLARALAVTVPSSLVLCLFVGWYWRRWEQRLPPLASPPQEYPLLRLGRWRWVALATVLAVVVVLLGIPLTSLIWRAGHVPPYHDWSANRAGTAIGATWKAQRGLIAASIGSSLSLGAIMAIGAAWVCWLAREHRALRGALLLSALVTACLPGPVLGIALKESIEFLVAAESWLTSGRIRLVDRALYTGPSMVPVFWASGLRLLPAATAMLWPAVRSVPQELFEQARLDGAGPAREWQLVAWPGAARAAGITVVAVAALSLGELGAGKLVAVPGNQTFAHEVFQQMHYGVEANLAAMCLLMLAMGAAIGLIAGAIRWIWRRADGPAILSRVFHRY